MKEGLYTARGTSRPYVMTPSELLDAAADLDPSEEILRQLLAAAGETPTAFRAALEAKPGEALLCMWGAVDQHTPLGRSVVLAMINAGAPTVLDAVARNFKRIHDDELASEVFVALEKTGRLEHLRPAVGKFIRRAFDLLMEDRGDPWGNIAIDRHARPLAQYIERLPGPLRDEALKILHAEGSRRGSDAWQATTASWLEERTLDILGERR